MVHQIRQPGSPRQRQRRRCDAAQQPEASALEHLRGHLSIEQHLTVAIGDGRNDIEMLTWAGRGVAMGQAPDEVIAAADEVTMSVHDDGAAHILRSLLS